MGGYISGVAIHIAQMKKIKTIIHEQNSVLGLANKLVYKKANKLLLSFPIIPSRFIRHSKIQIIYQSHKLLSLGRLQTGI